ncbi:MAG: class I SAM-dependent methyltransferase [bacterium]
MLKNDEPATRYNSGDSVGKNEAIKREIEAGAEKELIATRANLEPKWVLSSTKDFEQVFADISLTGKERVLEIGAGTGWATSLFSERGCECVATDVIKANKLSVADYWYGKKKIYFDRVLTDMDAPCFKGSSFDIIFGVSTFMYSRDVCSVMRELYRVLKPGGMLLLIDEPVVPIYKRDKSKRCMGSGKACDIVQWNRYIKGAGFKIARRHIAHSVGLRFARPELILNRRKWYYYVAVMGNKLGIQNMLDLINHSATAYVLQTFGVAPLIVIAVK